MTVPTSNAEEFGRRGYFSINLAMFMAKCPSFCCDLPFS